MQPRAARQTRRRSNYTAPRPLPRGRSLSRSIACPALLRFPQLALDDGKAATGGKFVDQAGEVFGGGALLHQKQWLALLSQDGDERVGLLQDQAVIELLVDPAADDALDLGEVEHHAAGVERRRSKRDHSPRAVAMEVAALAGVIQQPVAVAKVEFS